MDHPDKELNNPLVRRLSWLVTGLTLTMIVGLLVIVTILILTFQRINRNGADINTSLEFPSGIALPEGQTAQAITKGSDWIAVVTTDEAATSRILILSSDGQTLRQTVEIASQ